MATTKEYDESVERKLRELRGEEQPLFAPGAIIKTADAVIEVNPPKRRGRPPGSKNKPKA